MARPSDYIQSWALKGRARGVAFVTQTELDDALAGVGVPGISEDTGDGYFGEGLIIDGPVDISSALHISDEDFGMDALINGLFGGLRISLSNGSFINVRPDRIEIQDGSGNNNQISVAAENVVSLPRGQHHQTEISDIPAPGGFSVRTYWRRRSDNDKLEFCARYAGGAIEVIHTQA